MAKNKFKFKSYVKEISSDIDKLEGELLREASKHVRKKMRIKVSKKARSFPGMPPGINKGDLKKGIKFQVVKDFLGKTAFVGLGRPAQHGHLLEFGTAMRYTKKGIKKGQVLARPFLRPTFEEEAEAVKRIMMGYFQKI